MNKKIKSLLASGIVSLGMIFGSVSQSDAMTYMYTNANVNVRKYNSTSSAKVGYVTKGTKVATYNTVDGWKSVRLSNGTWGYIKATYLSSKSTSSQVSQGKVLKKLVIINKDSLKCAYYENGKLITSFRCAIGKSSTPTPSGNFTVINKEKNRPYYKKGIAGGASNNPLGTRFIQLTTGGIAIHGTCYPNSIGSKVSNGCIRLLNSNVEWLYNKVTLGTHVVIGNGYNKDIAKKYGYKIY